MNKKLICLLMLVFSLGLTFTACGGDDDNYNNTDVDVDAGYTQGIQGIYAGKLNLAGFVTGLENEITLSKKGENAADLQLNDFTLSLAENVSIPVKNIAMPDVRIARDGDIYKLGKTTGTITVDTGADLSTEVSVEGTVRHGQMLLVIAVGPIPDFEQGLIVTFAGNKILPETKNKKVN
ncbi:MAG: calycin-like domain-containing protein [Prevotella sp.]|jgi:hypothetical protein|nr:calycin-like domain-containing protein [Prevotella sp.]